MAKPVRLTAGTLNFSTMRRGRCLSPTTLAPETLNLVALSFEPAESIQQTSMGRGVDKRPVIMLAVNLHQNCAQVFQYLRAHGLVVHEGTGTSIGELNAAQNEFILGRNVVLGHQNMGRMGRRQIKGR